MRKLVLLVILWVVVTYYFPDSRVWLASTSRPLWTPFVKWDAREEMKQIAGAVVTQEVMTGRLPDRRAWLDWLDAQYSGEGMASDPWGSKYQLRVWADSVAIWSYGPDRTRNTPDDFQVSRVRQRRRR